MGTSRIKIMNTALKEMRTMKKTREHLSELAIGEDLTMGQLTDRIHKGRNQP